MEITRDPDTRLAHARDASGLEMMPEAVARAATSADVVEVIRFASASGTPITPAGSQTSMTGASITGDGILLSLAAMNRVLDVDPRRALARVEPGVTIGELNRVLAEQNLMFAPDPTSEQDATVGGAIACNASGARSLFYGPTRRHVTAVHVAHADGSLTEYRRSHPEKNTVGYAAVQDPVDWFIGSEGTLGIVVEAELSLVPLPSLTIGLAIPFADESNALEFVVAAREGKSGRLARCLEFFDQTALGIAAASVGAPWATGARSLIYLEDDGGLNGSSDLLLSAWLELAEARGALSDDIRVFEGAHSLREARVMRHSVPATMNERGAAVRKTGGRKVSTDWAVSYSRLGEALAESRAAVERHGAPAPVTYGHAGNGHPHQNFIAENPDSLDRIKRAVDETIQTVIQMGGTVSAEHGLGKLKKEWLAVQLAPRQIAMMRAIKNTLDPRGLFSPGNIL
ncbi:MAG TPA: FAD-binding oxidoreductase [Gemmatimonadaceae bacterium]|nr:FAD-binding oxidoreductase [Gemmatimonadaceae bacterium]